MDFAVLAQQCAPQVPLHVAAAIVQVESGFNPFAIGVNKGARLAKQPSSPAAAVTIANKLLSDGVNFDSGLAQINSENFKWLGLDPQSVFDPCKNLYAMQQVFTYCLNLSKKKGGGNHTNKALSCYNTGRFDRGFRNGYVAKVNKHLSSPVSKPLPVGSDKLALVAESMQSANKGLIAVDYVANHSPDSVIINGTFKQGETVYMAKLEGNTTIEAKSGEAWDVFSDFN